MTANIFEHPVYGSLFSDGETSEMFSVEADIQAMLRFELELTLSLAELSVIPDDAATRIAEVCRTIDPDIQELAQGTGVDGIPVPNLVKQIKSKLSDDDAQYVHLGATSQDVIDTSLLLRLQNVFPLIETRLETLLQTFDGLDSDYGQQTYMAHTRMQRALPVSVSDKLKIWRKMFQSALVKLPAIRTNLLKLQFGGPVGTLHTLKDKGPAVAQELGKRLGLAVEVVTWHTDRLSLVKFTDWLSHLSGALGKIASDIIILSQNEVGTISLTQGGGSSSMPHKNNPVPAEIVVAASRYISLLNAAMHQALVHENERSGAAWAMEWMALPQIVVATGGALKNTDRLLQIIKFNPEEK